MWLLLGDTVITKIPTTVDGHVFALGWLILGTNCVENRERSLHTVAQETINLNVTSKRRIQVCTLM